MAYLTAYGALVRVANLHAGDSVVVTAASSSVGLAAIQIVIAGGGVPIAVTRSEHKRAALLAAGAKHVVLSDENGIAEAILDRAKPTGPRIAFDAVGGALLPKLVSALTPGSIIISYGAQDATGSELVRDAPGVDSAKRLILDHSASGALRPVISRSFPLEDIRSAYDSSSLAISSERSL